MTPQEQAHLFLSMMICGAGLGVMYDLLGPIRRVRGLCALTDLFFGLCCAVGMILTALALRCEPMRFYTFAAIVMGMAFYGVTIGKAWRFVCSGMKRKIGEKCKNRQRAAGI